MTCWIKIAPARVVLCMFCLLRCGLAPAITTAPRDMLDRKRLFVTVGSKLFAPVLFSKFSVCCDAGLLLPSKPLLMTCWIKTALRDMLDQHFSRQCCSVHFLSAARRASTVQQGPATEIHFCVHSCELRVASPAHARAFVPARGSQVVLGVAFDGNGYKPASSQMSPDQAVV